MSSSLVQSKFRSNKAGKFLLPEQGKFNPRGKPAGYGYHAQAGSEEKVALVGFPFRPAVPPEAYFFGIVSAEFIAKKLPIRCPPWL